jgi:hypothetical protein
VSFLKTDLERIDETLSNVWARRESIDENVDVFEIITRIVVG